MMAVFFEAIDTTYTFQCSYCTYYMKLSDCIKLTHTGSPVSRCYIYYGK